MHHGSRPIGKRFGMSVGSFRLGRVLDVLMAAQTIWRRAHGVRVS